MSSPSRSEIDGSMWQDHTCIICHRHGMTASAYPLSNHRFVCCIASSNIKPAVHNAWLLFSILDVTRTAYSDPLKLHNLAVMYDYFACLPITRTDSGKEEARSACWGLRVSWRKRSREDRERHGGSEAAGTERAMVVGTAHASATVACRHMSVCGTTSTHHL